MAANAVRHAASSTRLVARYLPWTVGRNEMFKHFKQYGMVTFCQVLFDHNTGFSKGFGFVEFADKSAFNEAQNAVHIMDGVKVRVEIPESDRIPQRRPRNRGDGVRVPDLNKIMGDIL